MSNQPPRKSQERDITMRGKRSIYVEENNGNVTYIDNIVGFHQVIFISFFAGIAFALYGTVRLMFDLVLQGNLTGFTGRLVTLVLLFCFSATCGFFAMQRGRNVSHRVVGFFFSYMYLALTCGTYLIVSWTVVYNYEKLARTTFLPEKIRQVAEQANTVSWTVVSNYEKLAQTAPLRPDTIRQVAKQADTGNVFSFLSTPYFAYISLLIAMILATMLLGAISRVNMARFVTALVPCTLLNIMFVVHKYVIELTPVNFGQFAREIGLFVGMVCVIVFVNWFSSDDSASAH
jgi:hypothetical protein